MHNYYNSSIRKKYISFEGLLDCNIYHTRDIENFVKVSFGKALVK